MPPLPVLSGTETVRNFERWGWNVVRQRGSHIADAGYCRGWRRRTWSGRRQSDCEELYTSGRISWDVRER